MDMVIIYYPILHKLLLKIPLRIIHKLQVCEQNRFIGGNKKLTLYVELGADNGHEISPLPGIDWVCLCNKDLAEKGPKKEADHENWQ